MTGVWDLYRRCRQLKADARAYREAASLVQEHVRSIEDSARQDELDSLRNACLFNFGVSLELHLKCLLKTNGRGWERGPTGHKLAHLFEKLPPAIAQQLEDTFRDEAMPWALHNLTGYAEPKPSGDPPPRGETDSSLLKEFSDFCNYFDKDMRLWDKRYHSWEREYGDWVRYIRDLSVFLDFLERMEQLATSEIRRVFPDQPQPPGSIRVS